MPLLGNPRTECPYHMWHYWKAKYGAVEALISQYPKTLEQTPALKLAVAQIQVAEAAISQIMDQLVTKEEDGNG